MEPEQNRTVLTCMHTHKFWHQTMEDVSSDCVFLDLTKAFDLVEHSRILAALMNAVVSGSLLQWFTS